MSVLASLFLLHNQQLNHRARCQQNHFKPINMPNYRQPQMTQLANQQVKQQQQQRVNFRPFSLQMQRGQLISAPSLSRLSDSRQQASNRNDLIAKINERVYLTKLAQHRQQHQQQQLRQYRQTKSLEQHSTKLWPISDRRASSSWSPNHVLGGGSNQKVKFIDQTNQMTKTAALDGNIFVAAATEQTKPSMLRDDNKLLICYYTTPQTAPYWPKDSREFIVPTDELNELVNKKRQQVMNLKERTHQQAHNDMKASEHSMSSSNHNIIAHHHDNLSRAKMILVAPKFVPFVRNHSTSVIVENSLQPSGDQYQAAQNFKTFGGNKQTMSPLFYSQQPSSASTATLTTTMTTSGKIGDNLENSSQIASRQDNSERQQQVGQSGLTSSLLPVASELIVLPSQAQPTTNGRNNGQLGGHQQSLDTNQSFGSFSLIAAPSSSFGQNPKSFDTDRNNKDNNIALRHTIRDQAGGFIGSTALSNAKKSHYNGESNFIKSFVPNLNRHNSMMSLPLNSMSSRSFVTDSNSVSQNPLTSLATMSATMNNNNATNNDLLVNAPTIIGSPKLMSKNYYYQLHNIASNNNNLPSSTTISFPGPSSSNYAISSAASERNSLQQHVKILQMAESELSPALQTSASPMSQTSPRARSTSATSLANDQASSTAASQSPPTGVGFSSSSSAAPAISQHQEHLLQVPNSLQTTIPISLENNLEVFHKTTPTLIISSASVNLAPSHGTTSINPDQTIGSTSSSNQSPEMSTFEEIPLEIRQRQQEHHKQTGSSPFSSMFDVFGAASQYLMRFKPSSLISPSSFVSPFNNNANQQQQQQSSSKFIADLDYQLQAAASSGAHLGQASGATQQNNKSAGLDANSLLSNTAASSFISFPFSQELITATNSNSKSNGKASDRSTTNHSSKAQHGVDRIFSSSNSAANQTSSSRGFLSLFSLHGGGANQHHQQQQQQQQRREESKYHHQSKIESYSIYSESSLSIFSNLSHQIKLTNHS